MVSLKWLKLSLNSSLTYRTLYVNQSSRSDSIEVVGWCSSRTSHLVFDFLGSGSTRPFMGGDSLSPEPLSLSSLVHELEVFRRRQSHRTTVGGFVWDPFTSTVGALVQFLGPPFLTVLFFLRFPYVYGPDLSFEDSSWSVLEVCYGLILDSYFVFQVSRKPQSRGRVGWL